MFVKQRLNKHTKTDIYEKKWDTFHLICITDQPLS